VFEWLRGWFSHVLDETSNVFSRSEATSVSSDENAAQLPSPCADGLRPQPEGQLQGSIMRSGTGCGPVILDFCQLAGIKREVFIRLDGETYRLCRTRNNKLILTK